MNLTLRILFLAVLSFSIPLKNWAQKDLFQTEKLAPRKGFLLGANGAFDIPAGDLKDRFGNSYRIGPSIHYKTKSNWIFGVKLDFNNGDQVKEDSLMSNIKDATGAIANIDGQKLKVNTYRRGYMIGVEGGYIFNTSSKVSDNGIMLLTGIGFMQHKILIQDKGESILPLRGSYRKGYDRLTNGLYVEQYIGYLHLSNNALVNFHIGIDCALGFTQGRRDFLYDVRRPGNDKRFDVLLGIRGGWYLPIFKRKSEELFFE